MGTKKSNGEIKLWGSKYIPKYDKNAVLKFHSLDFHSSLQNEWKTYPTPHEFWSSYLTVPTEVSVWGEQGKQHHSMEKTNKATCWLWSYRTLAALDWLLECLFWEKIFRKAQFHFQNFNKAKAPGAGKKIKNVHTFKSIQKESLSIFRTELQGAAAVYVTLLRVPRALQVGKGVNQAQAACRHEYIITNVLLSGGKWFQIPNIKQ